MKQKLAFQFSSLEDLSEFEMIVRMYVPMLKREGLRLSGLFTEAEKELAKNVYDAQILENQFRIEIHLN